MYVWPSLNAKVRVKLGDTYEMGGKQVWLSPKFLIILKKSGSLQNSFPTNVIKTANYNEGQEFLNKQ